MARSGLLRTRDRIEENIASRLPGVARAALCAALATTVAAGGAARVSAAAPANFTDTLVATVDSPTSLAFAPNGRILVTTQFGALRVIANDVLLTQPALDLGSSVCTNSEQGLLGVEVDPAFSTNGFVYLYYTHNSAGDCRNRVSRFVMSGDAITPSSETVLIDGIPSPAGNHNAGDLHFAKDGYLYVSVGDGGCDYDGGGCAGGNDASRDQFILLGKILRITSTGGIPSSNPFVGTGTARCAATGRTTAGNKCQETYAWGLRNPFRITFDPNAAGTRFFINDTGQNDWEEVDQGVAGADYGWNVREGPCAAGSRTNCGPPPAGMTNPVHSYVHEVGGCTAITGGAFVPNGIWPAAYDGTYLYGDYTCGKIFLLTPDGGSGFTRTEFATNVGAVVNLAFGPAPVAQAPAGQALYYTNYTSGGQVRRIAYSIGTNRPPTASITAAPTSGPTPLTVNFDGRASSDPDTGDALTYEWSFGDGSPALQTSSPTTSHTYTTSGNFTATLTVRDNRGASSTPAGVQVFPGNTPPQVTIDTPAASTQFVVGRSYTLHGTATDAEDGTLPASSLSWRVLRHHDTHAHPWIPPTTGNDVQLVGPPPEDLLAAANSYLELELTATDSRGLTTTVTRDLQPRKVDLTLATNPTGLQLEVNGEPISAPRTLTSWEGWALNLSASTQVDGSGRSWAFTSWSDGGAASHSYTTPASPATLTATFTQSATPPGLVAAYSFSEATGLSVADRSGTGNGGTVSGAAWTAAGKYGSALSFDGVNDWVTVADAASLDVVRVTLEAWVRPTALGSWRTVLLKERPGGLVYGLYGSQGGGMALGQVDIGGERNALGSALPLNTWTHLAVTYDGSVLRLYVNGAASGTAVVAGTIPASTGVLRIGGNGVWSEWFAGQIDEVRVYNRALSQAEIQNDLQTPVGSTGPAPGDTVAPTAPGSLTATAAAGTVDLAWQAATDNVGVTGYDVHRGASAGFTPTAANRIAQVNATAYRDSGLAAGTYHYKVIALDAAGNASVSSNVASATVPDTQAPTAPGSLTANVSSNAADLAWQSSTDNVGVVGYDVHRGTVSGFTPSAANRVIRTTLTTYRDAGLAAGTYYYKVVAADAAGNPSPASNQAIATVSPPADTQAPSAPGTLTASTAASAVDLAWGAATDNVGVTGYDVHRGTSAGFTPSAANRLVRATATTYRDPSLAAATYYYRVIAVDGAGNAGAPSNEASATVSAAPPAGLVAAYAFNEGTGTAVTDRSGTGNGGTISGATRTTSGKYGSALSFDGVNDWVTVADAASLDVGKVTVEAWVRPTALSSWRTVVFKERPGGLVYGLYGAQGGARSLGQVDIGGERNALGPAMTVNTWTHLAVTYDGSVLRLYVNGAASGTAVVAGTIPASTGPLRIGGNSVWAEWFVGQIDEVRVYNRALSQAEVQADMTTPL